jgi:phosphate transport system substrate-binding protein
VKVRLVRQILTTALIVAFTAPALAATQLTGAGSTFVYPFFSKAFYEYGQQHQDVTVNYQSIGSGGGIQQFIQKTVDFGASDVPMNADELKRAGDPVVQIPVALGGVAVVYNLPGIHKGLRLTGQLIADIYSGRVASWDDGAIAKLNPGSRLPHAPIVVVHRSDGSGTTYIFTDYLSHVSPGWKSVVGTGKSVSWPAQNSVGGKGNEGVAGNVRNAPGAIGYVELGYSIQNHMDSAAIQNRSGKWVNCSADTVSAAAATKPNISASDFSIVDREGVRAYPISGYTWAMVYQKMGDKGRAQVIRDVLAWVVSKQGQSIAGSLDYAPLPGNVQQTAQHALSQIHI